MLDDEQRPGGLAETVEQLLPPTDQSARLWAERVEIEMPIELYVRQSEGHALSIEASAPSQRIRTSILPVFHRLHIVIEADSTEDAPVDRT